MRKKKKIIRVTTVPSSLNAFCKGMLRELSGVYEVVGVSSPGEELDEVAKREGVRTIAVPMERRISILKDCLSLWLMCRVFRNERPDMVHSMTPKAGFLSMVAAWIVKVPVRVHTFTGLVWPTSSGVKRIILRLTDVLTCACATHIIPEGEGVKTDLIKGRITNKPLKVLGHGNVKGVNLAFFSRTSEVMEKAKRLKDSVKFTFLFVGRIVHDKGVDELIDAFVRLYKEFPYSRLILVGPLEDSFDPISQTSRSLISACKDIETVGSKGGIDLLAYYAAADCFVLPSYREGFPNTVLEAGAMGLPSIVTDINGSREIIADGVNGIIVRPRSVDALYGAMKVMMQSKTDREHMANNARRMIANRFDERYVRQCLYEYYNEIL